MMRLFITFIFIQSLCQAQISDVERLANLSYMKYAHKVNCDSTSGTTLEDRICLNLEFQRIDSVLNTRLNSYLNTVKNDSLQRQVKAFQSAWVINRRRQSEMVSKGFNGHMLGIYYLIAMIETTRKRIEELEFLIEMKEN